MPSNAYKVSFDYDEEDMQPCFCMLGMNMDPQSSYHSLMIHSYNSNPNSSFFMLLLDKMTDFRDINHFTAQFFQNLPGAQLI